MSPATWDPFAESLRFAGVGDGFGHARARRSPRRGDELGGEARLLYYLSLPPSAMPRTVEALGDRRPRRAAPG